MRAYNVTKAVALALSVAWVAGCSTSGSSTDTSSTATETDSSAAQAVSVDSGVSVSYEDVANLQTVFYFDFDKAVVKSQGFADLEKHAQYLATNPTAQVVLEGHADERGTREYNMALGERRAKSVRDFLVLQGVDSVSIETVSYGEEYPAEVGSSESSYAKNRRVELK